MKEFRELGLNQEILDALDKMHFSSPTEIQEKSIPLALAGHDVIAESATGSGKTLAFGAPIIQLIEKGSKCQALIITPTRELAEQIGDALKKFSINKKLNIAVIYGGVSISGQIREIEISEIIVGTPGRILDHLQRGTLKLDKLKFLVLDEADRMLDMGFIDDVDKIISQCNKGRQTFLFSATLSTDIAHLSKKYLKAPKEVSVKNQVDSTKLKQIFYDVPQNEKFRLLVHMLRNEKSDLVMVFCNTRSNTDFVADNLKLNDIDAIAIHGGLSQDKRNKIMSHFHKGKVFVLVCTDVAARGLDVKGVTHVYNYDSPDSDKDYIHRIGRTARAGKDGKAVSIVASRDYANFRKIMSNPDIKIIQEKTPETKRVILNLSRNKFRRTNFSERRMDRRRSSTFDRGNNWNHKKNKKISHELDRFKSKAPKKKRPENHRFSRKRYDR